MTRTQRIRTETRAEYELQTRNCQTDYKWRFVAGSDSVSDLRNYTNDADANTDSRIVHCLSGMVEWQELRVKSKEKS